MKALFALFAAVALSAATAQKPAFQGTHPIPKPPLVAPAATPAVLHTGRPLTDEDKSHVLDAAINAYEKKNRAQSRRATQAAAPGKKVTLTPDKWYKEGIANLTAGDPVEVDPEDGILSFSNNGGSSGMTLLITVTPDTAYTLVFKTESMILPGASSPQLNIRYGGGWAAVSQSVPLTGSDEFAYAFVSSGSGSAQIWISANVVWSFDSCEIVATPLN
jgi:hypothetical protein